MALLGDLSARGFLKHHWQKSPYLIRRAFPNFIPPISPDELAGLACEARVESRLFTKARSKPGWRVRHGPFTKEDFRALPDYNWTLLVQDTDKHLPALAEFLDHFRFIPSWRMDDLMVSYATRGGSVGPHVDRYDVFLLQAAGSRRWQVNGRSLRRAAPSGGKLQPIRPLKSRQNWVLRPGDMLYLPPGIRHHGIALDPGMTFSIGFRAPSAAAMLSDLTGLLLQRLETDVCYTDPDLSPSNADPGVISNKARTAIRRMLRAGQHLSTAEMDEWFGRFITEPKPWLVPAAPRRPLTPTQLRRALVTPKILVREPAALTAWYPSGPLELKLFANGVCHTLPARLAELAKLLCGVRIYPAQTLGYWLSDPEGVRLLATLHNAGLLQIQ